MITNSVAKSDVRVVKCAPLHLGKEAARDRREIVVLVVIADVVGEEVQGAIVAAPRFLQHGECLSFPRHVEAVKLYVS